MQRTNKQTVETDKYAPLSDYSSSIKHILIPLPGFENYHQTGTENIEDKNFIGRKTIIAKLKSWIINSRTYTGAYLITGYRGMGKSSFVGKVLYDLSHESKRIPNIIHFITKILLMTLAGYICFALKQDLDINRWLVSGVITCIIGILIVAKIRTIAKKEINLHSFLQYIKGLSIKRNKIQYIPVRINIGNEILHDKEILNLICKSVSEKFSAYVKDTSLHLTHSYTALILELVTVCAIFKYVHFFQIEQSTYDKLNGIIRSLNEMILFVWSNYLLGPVIAFLVIYFIIICTDKIVWKVIEKLHILPYSTFSNIQDRLELLCERCVAGVSEDYSLIAQHFPLNPFRKKIYPIASVREIEQSLIGIFEDIQHLRGAKLRFIIIFDELDKVDMKEPDSGNENEEPIYDPSTSGFSGTMNSRKRKEALMRTLGDMKYFLSTVKAKFIFIAGRELYDAYLTDVSDREFSISSVFDGIINVNSFLKPPSHTQDITAMTEEYLCERLFPQSVDRKVYPRNLKSYYKYEVEQLGLDKEDTPEKEKKRKRTIRNISLLYQYSMYLTHISNGSPKKIAIFLEKDIRSRDFLIASKLYTLEEEDCDFYLSFGVKDIQRIGFMYYIASPIVQAMINKAKIYEDKLLVSTSFMINHIYKYHNNGFSWRNLEHIPELLEINKTPELRDFVGSIISFLRQTHLEGITSGLYLFKFPLKLSEEISFLSKRSETISAIFHFSRDESLPTKRHYINLLKYYTSKINTTNEQDLHTLASIHHILADIYLADEDYSQAIFEYQTGLQLLSGQLSGKTYDEDSHWVSYMLFYARNMLKLGLTYEKRKTFDSAYLAYSELTNTLVGYRLFDEDEWGLRYDINEKNFQLEKDAILYPISTPSYMRPDTGRQIIPAKWDGKYREYAFQGDHIRSEFARLLTPEKSSVIMRMSFFNDIRLAYLPALAKLFVLEKIGMEGITQSNLDIIEAEYFYLHVPTDDSEKVMASADFFQKLGDIMYYKNGLLSEETNNIFQSLYFWGYDLKRLIDGICLKDDNGTGKSRGESSYHQNRGILEKWFTSNKDYQRQTALTDVATLKEYLKIKIHAKLGNTISDGEWNKLLGYDNFPIDMKKPVLCMKHREAMLAKGKRLPCYACKYYSKSLNSAMTRILRVPDEYPYLLNPKELKEKSACARLFYHLQQNREQIKGLNESYLLLIANTLKGLGNVLMSCSDDSHLFRDNFLDKLFEGISTFYGSEKDKEKTNQEILSDLNTIEKALLYTAEAAIFFDIAGNKHSSFLMHKQIIEIFNAYLKVQIKKKREESDSKEQEFIKDFVGYLLKIEELTKQAIMQLYSHYEHVSIAEIQQLKNLFNKDVYENVNLNTLPLSPDIEEVIYRFYTLKIKCKESCIDKLYTCTLMGPYKQISTLSQNVANLRFKVLLNEKIAEKLFEESIHFDYTQNISHSEYINALSKYFRQSSKVFQIIKDYNIQIGENRDLNQKIDIINYLISDSLFCLSKIFDLIIPLNNTTLFSYSFLGEISEGLLQWNYAFEILYLVYLAVDHSDNEPERYHGKILFERYNKQKPPEDKLYRDFDLLKNAMANLTEERNLSCKFMDLVRKSVSQDSFQHLINNYQIESAIRNYSRAVEMHTEGKAYKEMIQTLYFLDDDLNNDTYQQHISIERYLINTGFIEEKIEHLKMISKSSPIYEIDSYLK